MKNLKALIAQLLTLSFGAVALLCIAPQPAKASEKLFTDQKCQRCHNVSAYGIEKKKEAAAEGEEGEEGGVEPPDLSNTGNFHDAAFLSDFLAKKAKHTAHAGNDSTKKHPTKFKGTDDDMKALAGWLASLKKDPTSK